MRSKELYEDEDFLEDVMTRRLKSSDLLRQDFSDSRVGDIWFFSNNGTKADNYDPKFFHLAVVSQIDDNQKPVFLHTLAYKKRDTVVEWPLEKFSKSRFYQIFHGIRRVRSKPLAITASKEQLGYELFWPTTEIKSPEQCSFKEIQAIKQLILLGGQVSSKSLDGLLARAYLLVWSKDEKGKVIAVGAIKNPYETYSKMVFKKAGVKTQILKWGEVGWLYTLPEWRNNGVSQALLKELTKVKKTPLYATTKEENYVSRHMLEKNGFMQVGSKYLSKRGDYFLVLYVESSAKKAISISR